MNLPPLLVLTDRTMCPGSLRDTVATAVHCGATALVVREKDLPAADRASLLDDIADLLAPVGGVLIGAGTATSRGHGVHLAAADPFPAPRPGLVGRSCHNADEIARAAAEGCDYITVSPVFLTASKPGYGPALGLRTLAELSRYAPPVYALGGVQPDDVPGVLAAGARGIAVMGPVMRDPTIVSRYLEKLPEVSR